MTNQKHYPDLGSDTCARFSDVISQGNQWWRSEMLAVFSGQGPITWSEQLPCTCVTAFSLTSLFLERFYREFRISLKPHKPASKTYRPKNANFCLLMTLRCPFWYPILRMRSWTWRRFHFRGKKCPKMCLKINPSVKPRDIGIVWELLTPGFGLLLRPKKIDRLA